jgi:hypothetical protein
LRAGRGPCKTDSLAPEGRAIMDEEKIDEPFVPIATLNHDVEAVLLDAMLVDDDIPHFMQSYHDFALNSIYQLQKGWGQVSAPERCRAQILELLDEVRHSDVTHESTQNDAAES